MTELLLDLFEEQSLFMVLPNDRLAQGFDVLMRFKDGQVTTETTTGDREPEALKPGPEAAQPVEGEVA